MSALVTIAVYDTEENKLVQTTLNSGWMIEEIDPVTGIHVTTF